MIHNDQMGRFPVVSSKGHKCIMVLVDIDSNYIAMEPMQLQETAEIIKVYETIMARLKSAGLQPKKQILDNEAPRAYLDAIEAQGLDWELVPPNNHRRCIAERGIQTAKGHIIANLLGRSFGAHSTNAHYIRTSPNHYRCQEVLVNETKATRITDTMVFHHKNITNPSVSKADAIVAGASELTTTIKGNRKEDVTKMDLKKLEQLAQNFEAAAKKVSEANAGSQRVVHKTMQKHRHHYNDWKMTMKSTLRRVQNL
ncbi:hypothetical protein ACHAXN_005054 [Cyclotella atomus]